MPLRELQCRTCGTRYDELVKPSEFYQWREDVENGHFKCLNTDALCGVCDYVVSLTAKTTNSEWPYTFAPWTLPMRDGAPQIGVTANSRAEYQSILRKYDMVEPITPAEKATMYDSKAKDDIDEQARGDAQMYRALKNDPHAARRIIRESIAKRDAVA